MRTILNRSLISPSLLLLFFMILSCHPKLDDRIKAYANAQNNHDVEKIMSLYADDIIAIKETKEKEMQMFDITKELTEVKLSIVYDNNESNPKLKTAWGFGCVVETEDKVVLFDTGGDSLTLLKNMELLEIDPKKIELVFLSHIHGDHTGGLPGLLKINNNLKVFVPGSFPDSFKKSVESAGAEVKEISKAEEISKGIYSTGELGSGIIEQSLILNTAKGLVIITGCSHPGIVDIVKRSKELFKKKVYLVLGGFHLGWASKSKLEEIVSSFRKLGVEKVGPCHCSGNKCKALFKKEYKDDFIEVGVGNVTEIELH